MSAAEVLAQHADWVSEGKRLCSCFWTDGSEEASSSRVNWAAHVLDALKAAGYADPVELPKSDRSWAIHDAWTVDESCVIAAGRGHVFFEDEESVTQLDANTAIRMAACLLAAACVAEATS